VNGTVTEPDVAALRELALGDENTGSIDDRIQVIVARAQLAELGVHLHVGHTSRLLDARAKVGLTLERVDPEGVIADLGRPGDDKDEEWGGNPVLTPPRTA
jgi:hypothetical protein